MRTQNFEGIQETLDFWDEAAEELLKYDNYSIVDLMCAPVFEILVALSVPQDQCPHLYIYVKKWQEHPLIKPHFIRKAVLLKYMARKQRG